MESDSTATNGRHQKKALQVAAGSTAIAVLVLIAALIANQHHQISLGSQMNGALNLTVKAAADVPTLGQSSQVSQLLGGPQPLPTPTNNGLQTATAHDLATGGDISGARTEQ